MRILKKSRSKKLKSKSSDTENNGDTKLVLTVNGLRKKYNCEEHGAPCLIRAGKHKQLNFAQLNVWAREIVSMPNTDLLCNPL